MISFCKYEALGNDFILVDFCAETDYSYLSKILCDRHTGIGADGLIAVAEANKNPQMHFYNADGSRAAMCGNGIRCVAAYCVFKGKKEKKFDIKTDDGAKEITLKSKNPFLCRFCVGEAVTEGTDIGLKNQSILWETHLTLKNSNVRIWFVKLGVPHTVLINDKSSEQYAEEICNHPYFADRTNVDFVTVKDKNSIEVKTYERGVGWTKACGTGGGASAAVCNMLGLTEKKINVIFEQGELLAEISDKRVYLTGGANLVFEGSLRREK
jgi:diaminopimelate epimerase